MTGVPPDDDVRTQQRVFAFLTDPDAHPSVHRLDTHAASVFLEGTRALKIKRAVCFPFLDYSTLQKRKAACDDEIRINRPFAPQIYQRVVPITRDDDGALHIDGPGTPNGYCNRNDALRRAVDARPPRRGRSASTGTCRSHRGCDRGFPCRGAP